MSGGLYNMVVPANPARWTLFVTLEIDPGEVPRFRDIWINRELTEITIFTRSGGGNRSEYAAENERMRLHPGFLRDADWVRGSTYAEWVFSVSAPRTAVMLADIEARPEAEREVVYQRITADATSKWDAAMAELEKGRTS